MKIGIPKENIPGEKRVAVVPETLPKLTKAGFTVLVEAGAGVAAAFRDEDYSAKGAMIAADAAALYADADIILKVRTPTDDEIARLRSGTALIGLFWARYELDAIRKIAARGVSVFSLDLLPRITRAQSMDVLSSMSSVAGYRCVLEAAMRLPKFFPMFMTAAGTIAPAKVLVIGAGVAGLQAIATARRLGAVVEAYDTRPAVKEEVMSLGAKFVELPLETAGADKGGYAKAQDEEFYRKQRELMAKHVAQSDVVITTALVPGKKAPVLVTAEMVRSMRPGSVVVDLAAEQGGNCELSRAGEDVVEGAVTIVGMKDVAARLPAHASQMYSRNVVTYLLHLAPKGELKLDLADDLTKTPLVAHEGKVLLES